MKRADLLELAGRNLREALLRNSLTTLGVAVGVASLVAMLSLGVGLQNLADDRLNRSGIFDTVVVYSRRDIPSFDRAERRSMGPTGDARRLDPAARKEMEALPNVTEVYPEVRFAIEARFGDQSNFATVAGLPPSARANDAFDDILGAFFSSPDADEAILHLDFARELAGLPASDRSGGFTPPKSSGRDEGATPPSTEKGVPANAPPEVAALLGQTITLRYAERVPFTQSRPQAGEGPASSGANATSTSDDDYGFSVMRREKPMRIVGIVTQEPFGGMRSFARGRLFIPIAVAEKLNVLQTSALRDAIRADASETVYTSLLVRVSDPVRVAAVQDAIKRMGFTTWSMLDAARNLRVVFAIFDTFLGAFGSLALAVASLGIVNTLVMAILERRREIGIMKALGASDRDIKQIFFTEAAAMGLAGGALGVLLGWAIGQLINFGVALWLQRQDLPPQQIWATPLWLVASAILFSVIVSLFAGLYPASRAAKLDPVQALRYE
jgi:putative ABC transport system permease protein